MKLCLCFLVLGTFLLGASSRSHSLKYFYTASSGIKNFPEFVTVGMVDDVVFTHYDSNIKREVPKQDWIKKVTEGDPQYWDRNSQIYLSEQQSFKANIEIARKRLNRTEGVHLFQNMYGCEWDDETREVRGYYQFAFDGEDFIAFDLETATYIAPRPEAFITKLKWDKDVADNAYKKNYFTQICPDWIKKYLDYGKETLLRTVLPSISLLQKSSSSPVTCHATGFYPDGAMLFWTKDGEELYDGVEIWEVLPNHDGTFQKSADLDVSSIPASDWGRYRCVFQLSGVKEDVLTKLDPAAIRSNEKRLSPLTIAGIVCGVFVAALVALGLGVWCKRRKPIADKRTPSPVSTEQEELNPTT